MTYSLFSQLDYLEDNSTEPLENDTQKTSFQVDGEVNSEIFCKSLVDEKAMSYDSSIDLQNIISGEITLEQLPTIAISTPTQSKPPTVNGGNISLLHSKQVDLSSEAVIQLIYSDNTL